MPRPRGDVRERLLTAARERFLSDGVDGASLRKIAADAGSNVGMIHYYFGSKEALFFEVVDDRYGALLGDFEAILSADEPVLARFERLSVRVGTMDPVETEVLRIVMRELLASSERRRALLRRFERGHVAVATRALSAAQGAGQLRGDLPLSVTLIAALATMLFPQAIARVVAADERPGPLRDLPAPEALAAALRAVLEGGLRGAHIAS